MIANSQVCLAPPFTLETAILKVRKAEDGWNSRNPSQVALAYTINSHWRNRSEFLTGRDKITAFLTRKWANELEYRLIKELWAFRENPIAVRFAYESRDAAAQWRRRHASINDLAIRESERLFHCSIGRRPDGHPELSDLGL
jgi:nuclear transport factor 2 (NTF2) superfamily protein